MKRGNVIAAVFVTLLLLSGVGVVTYTSILPSDDRVDYNKILSEIKSALDRLFSLSSEKLIESGFSNESNVWYCNEPVPPNKTEVGSSFGHFIKQDIDALLNETGIKGVEISFPNIDPTFLDDDSMLLNITNFNITITRPDEYRVMDLSMNPLVQTSFGEYYSTLIDWMECNAGNITQNFLALNQKQYCQFESCCCGSFPMTDPLIQAVIDQYGLTEEQVFTVLQGSVDSLNDFYAGAEACGEEGTEDQNVVCSLVLDDTNVIVDNDVNFGYEDSVCGNPSCAIVPVNETTGALTDWPLYPEPPQGCPLRVPLDVPTAVGPYIPDEPNPGEPGSVSSRYWKLALDRNAAANMVVRCEIQKKGLDALLDPDVFDIRIWFNLEYSCSLPEEPQDSSPGFCPAGGGGGACPCPGPSCEPLVCIDGKLVGETPTDSQCDEFCVMEKEGFCREVSQPCQGVTCACGEYIPGRCSGSSNNCVSKDVLLSECPSDPCPGTGDGPGDGPGDGGDGDGPGPDAGDCTIPENEGNTCQSGGGTCAAYVCQGGDCVKIPQAVGVVCDTCKVCSATGSCEEPAPAGTECGTTQCAEKTCNGGLGTSACTNIENPSNSACQSGGCQGICSPSTGTCGDYSGTCQNAAGCQGQCTNTGGCSSYAGACTFNGGSCGSYTSQCTVNGVCEDDGRVCCADGNICATGYCCNDWGSGSQCQPIGTDCSPIAG